MLMCLARLACHTVDKLTWNLSGDSFNLLLVQSFPMIIHRELNVLIKGEAKQNGGNAAHGTPRSFKSSVC